MERRQESAEFLYEGNELRGFFKQNGSLKLYTAKEASLSDLPDIIDPVKASE